MEQIYASLIIKGIKKLEDVPKSLKKVVLEILVNLGYQDLSNQ